MGRSLTYALRPYENGMSGKQSVSVAQWTNPMPSVGIEHLIYSIRCFCAPVVVSEKHDSRNRQMTLVHT